MAAGQIKPGRHLALIGTLPHQFRPSTPAQNKAQGIKQNRLPGPCFAGQHIQTRLKFQFQPVDNQHVPDV